jgi:tRNA A-37 threonylcarbamoyl transferase component Bud32
MDTETRFALGGLLVTVAVAIFCVVASALRWTSWQLMFTVTTICTVAYSANVWNICSKARKRLAIAALDPIKAACPVPILLLLTYCRFDLILTQMWADITVSPSTLFSTYADVAILVAALVSYAIYWSIRWQYLILVHTAAVDHHAKVLQQRQVPKGGAAAGAVGSNLLFLIPFLNGLLMYVPLFVMLRRIDKSEKTYQQLELSDKYALQQAIRENAKRKSKPNEVLIRYRAFSGMERWLKDRLAQRSWKKGVLMLAFAIAFFSFNGPVHLLNGIIYLLSLIPGSNIGAQSLGTQAANTSAVGLLLNAMFYPLFLILIVYIIKPTHLLLTPVGIRFLWRNGLIRMNGRVIRWDAVEEIKLMRRFGKTLPQDASLSLVGRNKTLLNAKLANISSLDDKAAVLEALDKWAPRTSRSPEVTELLRPPADHSYTELWLQALTAPPKRERLKPLVGGGVLDDGKYQVQREIGSGGQGFAYLAKNLQTGETAVLKEYIMPVFVDMETRRKSLEQFEREARTLQSLDNDRVVKLLDFFIEDHRAYLVLEHIEGENLKQLVERSGPLSQSDCLKLSTQMCDILLYLHAKAPPVVHRDFTPDNLILRPDGTLKLIDFNVAQQREDSNFTGTVVGKHAYLPPEQFRGAATTRSDIYALGCCLFYLLIGRDPEPISVSHPHKEREEVSSEMDRIVARATALDETLRYQDVSEIKAELESTLASDS